MVSAVAEQDVRRDTQGQAKRRTDHKLVTPVVSAHYYCLSSQMRRYLFWGRR